MNALQLKNSILQEAIEGRLVPQNPNDEPASVLLDKIRAEKKRLVKEGKLKKKDLEEIPISEDKILFKIPESWEWCRLIDLCKTIQYGYTASAAPKGNCKLLRITDIQEEMVNWNTVPFCSIKEKDLETYQLHNRDILIARTGGTVGKTFIVRDLNELSVFASYLIRAIPLNNLYEEYIKIFMGTPYYWNQLTEAATGTGQPNVNGQSLSKLIIPIPPLEEQKRIVAKIEELLPKVGEYGKAQESLDKLNKELPERLKKSILQEAIEGRLVPQDPNEEPASVLLDKIRAEKKRLVKEGKLKKKDLEETPISEEEIPYIIPEGWEWCRLNDICIFLSRGKSPSYSDVPNEYPVFAQKCNLKDGSISLEQARFLNPESVSKWQEEYHLRTDDVLVNSTGTGTVCRTRLFHESCLGKYPFTVPDSHVSVVRTSDSICSAYIYSLFNSKFYQDYWEDRLAGSTNQKELYIGVLQNTIIPLPPLSEQKRIVEKIEQLFKEIDKLKVKL